MSDISQIALKARAKQLDNEGLNGIKLALVTLKPNSSTASEANLEVYFFNKNVIEGISKETKDKRPTFFTISGGRKILGGSATGQIKVTDVVAGKTGDSLTLTVKPVGDYSTYTLSIHYDKIDPFFNEINFKFRPGCFTTECKPEWKINSKAKDEPSIDYLAKDFDSFKHTMIATIMERVPNWQPTSEADLDQVLLELFSAAADELSDYQDRVMNEAYLNTARKRVSLARHARLMDYHIHQGNQASTWLALKLKDQWDLDENFEVWAGSSIKDSSSVAFVPKLKKPRDLTEYSYLDPLLNEIGLYPWSDSVTILKAGATSADLGFERESDANTIGQKINEGKITHFLIQEWLNPKTGNTAGSNQKKRQIVKLLPKNDVIPDPLNNKWALRINWEEQDKLKHDYYFIMDTSKGRIDKISFFHGNLIKVCHGARKQIIFKEAGLPLQKPNEFHYERTEDERWGTICKLPEKFLAYEDTPLGGEVYPNSTIVLEVELPNGKRHWMEKPSLIHSDDTDENGNHFVVETDEQGQSLIRFGNGVNGKKLPENAIVHCSYQIGIGTAGNIGADKLINFEKFDKIESCWNPFDVTNGREQEPVAEIIRRVPEAYKLRQLRAITLGDYEDRVQEVKGVSKSLARYKWTGSWRTVQIAIDPVGTTVLTDELRKKIIQQIDGLKLIGEDYEIISAKYVPLKIDVIYYVHPDYWLEDIKYVVEQEFSDSYTPDGQMAFFHPDRWSFGQELKESQIIGKLQSIEGVDYVSNITIKRWNDATPGIGNDITLQTNEIILVKNDPEHMENGIITFTAKGGRQ